MSEGEGERDSYSYILQFSTFLPIDICTSFAFDIFIFRHFYFRHFYFRPKFRESKTAHSAKKYIDINSIVVLNKISSKDEQQVLPKKSTFWFTRY
jgi:hypothetical protein